MAQLALAVAGSVIGNAIVPGIGGQIGFALGSALGGQASAQDQFGPRLAERTVQVSSYSAAIAEVWGGGRLAGNLIWSTDLVEAETTESAGKGGPEITTYSYSVSCAVAICEGVIGGIRRIWADAKLVYDAREDADGATLAGSAAFLTFMTVYTGTESQMPDATIEAAEGAGTVEAYRGTAYVVFTGLPLADYGNRVPNFSFEVTSAEPDAAPLDALVPYAVGDWTMNAGDTPEHSPYPSGAERGTEFSNVRYQGSVIAAGPFDNLADAIGAAASVLPGYEHVIGWTSGINGVLSRFPTGASLDDGDFELATIKIGPHAVVHVLPDVGGGTPDISAFVAGGVGVDNLPYDNTSGTASVLELDGGAVLWRQVYSTFVYSPPVYYDTVANHNTLMGADYPPPLNYPSLVYADLVSIDVRRVPSIPAQTCMVGDPVDLGIAQLPGNSQVCMTATGDLSPNITYAPESGTFKQLTQITYAVGVLTQAGLGPVLRTTDPNYSSSTFWDAEAAAAGVTGTYGVDYPVTVTDVGAGVAPAEEVAAGSALLSAIVSDICVDAGLTTGQIDVTDLDDVVLGYQRTRVMSARAALEPLRQAYFFDAVESGDLIRFVKRGGASIATLTLDDLGAGQEAATEAIEHDRGQQTELPASVAVAYQSPTADFQVGVQQSRRRVGGSQQAVQVELPLVLQDLTAAQICDVLLYDAWASRTGRKIAVTRAHAYIEPTDVITLDDGQAAYRVRVVDKVEDGGVIRLECRDDDASSYAPNSTAGVVSGGGSVIRFDGPSSLYLLDIPILRDADDGVGYYAAATGYRSTWRGARAFRSVDAGVSYATVRDLTARAVAGAADTVLATYAGGNTVDEGNTVDVTLLFGTLTTITRAQLLAGGNACVIGNEVLQFQRAELLTGTTYRLSGLLRGRVGTEQHMGAHELAERFVALSEGTTYRIAAPTTEIGQDSVWKAVTLGDTLADAFEVEFRNTAAGAAPLAPVHLFAASIGGSPEEWAVQWVRRTRIDGTWRDLVDVQLGEAAESYVVTVTRAGAVISTTTVTTQSATVEALAGDVITVAQVSAIVGPGFAASYTLT